MTTNMDLSFDSKFDMDRRPGSQMSFSGSSSSSVYRSSMSRSYSSPNRKVADLEAEKVMKNMMSTVEQERKDLDELNAKLASYIVSVRSKEATNKHLLEEIEKMKEAFLQTQSHIREEYSIQIEEAHSGMRELSEGLAPLKAKVASLEQTLEMKDKEILLLHKKVEELQMNVQKKDRTIGELEGECAVLRHQLQEIRQDNKRIRMDNDRIRSEQEIALTKQIKAQNECDTLAEEKKYVEITLHAEIRELRGLLSAFEFIQPNLEEVYKAEFRECIKAIQAEYNGQLAKLSTDRQGAYDVQHKQLEAEHSEMRVRYEEECSYFEREKSEMQRRITELEAELRAVMARLTNVRADSLNLEISTYRSLLDGKAAEMKESEEKKVVVSGLGNVSQHKKVDASATSNMVQTSSSSYSKTVTSQSSETVRMLTPLSIKEVDSAGNFLLIHNSSKQEMDLSNWHVERTHPKGTATFKVPSGTKIGAEKEMKIFATKSSDKKGANDIVATCKTWGSGNGQVKITDEKGQEVILFTYSFKEN